MITTLAQFISEVTAIVGSDGKFTAKTNDKIIDMFEYNCTDDLRDTILGYSDSVTPEPFRSAMYNLGFTNY